MAKYSMKSAYPKFKNIDITNKANINEISTANATITSATITNAAITNATITGCKFITVTKTSNYTAAGNETIIGVNTTGGAVTITLDSDLLQAGRIIIIKDIGGAAGTNNITVATEGSEKIDGADTKVISSNYGSITLFSDGSNWFVI